MYSALDENMKQITRKKFVNEKVVESISEAIYGHKMSLGSYNNKGKIGKNAPSFKSPFVIFNKTT